MEALNCKVLKFPSFLFMVCAFEALFKKLFLTVLLTIYSFRNLSFVFISVKYSHFSVYGMR